MSSTSDNTSRFTDRVSTYVSGRPSYPPEVATLLDSHFDLPKGCTIADVGSGTGILSMLLMDQLHTKDAQVLGVEPNSAMRLAAEELLAPYIERGSFRSVAAPAEKTSLDDDSVDLVVAGQAFHWFDVRKTKSEFARILSSTGGVALIWNDRAGMIDSALYERAPYRSPFMHAYEAMLNRHSQDYKSVNHHARVNDQTLRAFFGPDGFHIASFPNPYYLTFEQLHGRLLSSSYAPQEGQPGHEGMMKELGEIFEHWQTDGEVEFMYDARVFYGRLS